MKGPVPRRVDGVERILAAQFRTHYLFHETGETNDMIDARMRAMIASGEASANDLFVTFSWGPPAG